ncbi:MAG: ATP-dependent RecD-like DNA helicase [Clostridia bacterium]|nr:ATP-dependent RecD-like DNA helicase [Clostridia bacterium]
MTNDRLAQQEKIIATVERVTYRNALNGFCVVEMNSRDDFFTAVGELPEVAAGEELQIVGSWTTHGTFGRQFKIETFSRSLPDTSAKLFAYLSSGAVKGVGPKLAMKIIQRFGERTFDILENDPERLAEIKGISQRSAKEISQEFIRQFAMRKVLIELENYGITPSESTSIYKYFGAGALNTVRQNPYVLCNMEQGFSFTRVEELVEKMQLSPDPVYRNTAGILHVVRHNLYNNGHTCLPRRKMLAPCAALLSLTEDEADIAIDSLLEGHLLFSEMLNGEEFLFLPDIYMAEREIAERMKTILRFPPAGFANLEKEIDRSEENNQMFYADAQREAVRLACEKGLLILTGGPGTGKTTAVRAVIDVFEQKGLRVLLAAPTGRAAKRMSDVTGREAKTIHRLLEVEWNDHDKPVFGRNAQYPLEAEALIVDEMSMVDCSLFASLLDAVAFGCRLVLVGDADQLPSVGPGNVLNDLIASEKLPVVCLTEIFRQAQQSLIVTNAHRIIGGDMPVLDEKKSDFFFMPRNDSVAAADCIADLVVRRLPAAYGFSPINDIQVLCPSKKGTCGTMNLNKILQELLNPKDRVKNEITVSSARFFREGDKVMQTRNNYDIPWEKDGESGQGIFNGDVGILEFINYAAGLLKIRFDDRVAQYPTDHMADLELAYAVTVHKSQGSEFDCVVIPVCDVPPQLCYRNLLYTAVTRAKKLEVMVGRQGVIEAFAANDRSHRRYSALESFLCSEEKDFM